MEKNVPVNREKTLPFGYMEKKSRLNGINTVRVFLAEKLKRNER